MIRPAQWREQLHFTILGDLQLNGSPEISRKPRITAIAFWATSIFGLRVVTSHPDLFQHHSAASHCERAGFWAGRAIWCSPVAAPAVAAHGTGSHPGCLASSGRFSSVFLAISASGRPHCWWSRKNRMGYIMIRTGNVSSQTPNDILPAFLKVRIWANQPKCERGRLILS